MRAAVLRTYGEPPSVGELPDPEAGEGEVVLQVGAVPLTPLDVLCASGTSYFGEPPVPYVPGVQGVGRVAAADNVHGGTRVWFPTSAGMAPGDGSLATLATAAAEDLVPVPDGVPDTQVAALGLSAVAAWMTLTLRAGLRPGERVLVLGAGGVVGQVAVQAARLLDATAVYGASRSAAGLARTLALEPDGIVRLEDGDEPAALAGRIAEVCAGEVDVVVDPLGGVPATAALRCLAPGGRLVNLGASAGDHATFSSAHLRSGSRSVLGYTNNDLTREQRAAAFEAVLGHAAAGALAVDHDVVSLDDVADAWRRQAASPGRRIVITP